MESKRWKKIYRVLINQKKAGVAILIPDKVYFGAKEMTKEGQKDII